MKTAEKFLTLGEIAQRFHCQGWQVRRLFERGLLPEPSRVGPSRVIHEDDVLKVKAALEAAGYLK